MSTLDWIFTKTDEKRKLYFMAVVGDGCVFWCCFDILPPPPVYGKYDDLSSALNVVTDLLQFSKRKIDVVSWQNCHVCHVTGPQRTLILSLITAPFMMFR